MVSSSKRSPSRTMASRARPFEPEARLAIAAHGPLVEAEHREGHAVQADALEGKSQHQLRSLGAIALAPGVGFADADVEGHRAIVGIEVAEGGQPDVSAAFAQLDGVGDGLGRHEATVEEAVDLLVAHRLERVARQAGERRVAVPAADVRQVIETVTAEQHEPALHRLRIPDVPSLVERDHGGRCYCTRRPRRPLRSDEAARE